MGFKTSLEVGMSCDGFGVIVADEIPENVFSEQPEAKNISNTQNLNHIRSSQKAKVSSLIFGGFDRIHNTQTQL
jgi:hypothetical protein